MAIEFSLGNGQAMPSRASVGYLDPEIAGEGTKIILSDGEQVAWSPPPPAPVMPDWSKIKVLRQYFGRVGYQTWPCWLYHPTLDPVIIKDAQEAFERFGIQRRKATDRERALQGAPEFVWEVPDDCEWRPMPYGKPKFDPDHPGHGKTYVPKAADPRIAQNALIAELIPTVTAAVAAALQGSGGPSNVDPADWDEFIAFKAWKEAQAAVDGGAPALSAGHDKAAKKSR